MLLSGICFGLQKAKMGNVVMSTNGMIREKNSLLLKQLGFPTFVVTFCFFGSVAPGSSVKANPLALLPSLGHNCYMKLLIMCLKIKPSLLIVISNHA